MGGETILEVTNPAEALRNQDGKFRVVSPNGYVFQVSCRRGRKIRIREMGEVEPSSLQLDGWQIQRIA